MVTVAVLFVVGAAVRETGGVDLIAARLFGRPKTPTRAIARMMFPTMGLSAFMNNTPLVAMLIPAVSDWARSNRIAGFEADDPAQLRGDPRRHLHADRHQHEPGRAAAC